MRRFSFFIFLAAAVSVLRGALASAGETAPLRLASDAFENGKSIPGQYSCDGANRSPPLHWDGPPAGTVAFALLVDDPDAPAGNWNHWVLYNVPAAAQALGPSVPNNAALGDGSLQGTNDFGRVGYGGPCPPKGSTHHYSFRLYALSATVELQPGAKRAGLLKALKDKTLGQAELTGTYGR